MASLLPGLEFSKGKFPTRCDLLHFLFVLLSFVAYSLHQIDFIQKLARLAWEFFSRLMQTSSKKSRGLGHYYVFGFSDHFEVYYPFLL
jgi:hypothetical protein